MPSLQLQYGASVIITCSSHSGKTPPMACMLCAGLQGVRLVAVLLGGCTLMCCVPTQQHKRSNRDKDDSADTTNNDASDCAIRQVIVCSTWRHSHLFAHQYTSVHKLSVPSRARNRDTRVHQHRFLRTHQCARRSSIRCCDAHAVCLPQHSQQVCVHSLVQRTVHRIQHSRRRCCRCCVVACREVHRPAEVRRFNRHTKHCLQQIHQKITQPRV